jgi:glycosyltransferase involved in cell wall biosynthesis
MTPTVTVLMSVYNSLPYLREAVDSILAQTYDAFEFLIVDDASTDGSRAVLHEYARKDPRIRILENDVNQGLGFCLNRGLEAAGTPWVARMDADDVAFPERLALQMQYLDAHPEVDVLGGAAVDCDAA